MAVIREKTVSTSAARVAGLRHSALDSRRMADSITPAWLMPIQKTKLTMKKPHMTGRFSPVTPIPRLIITPAAANPARTMRPRTATANQNHRGEYSIDPRRSRLICLAGRTLPSCIFLQLPVARWSVTGH